MRGRGGGFGRVVVGAAVGRGAVVAGGAVVVGGGGRVVVVAGCTWSGVTARVSKAASSPAACPQAASTVSIAKRRPHRPPAMGSDGTGCAAHTERRWLVAADLSRTAVRARPSRMLAPSTGVATCSSRCLGQQADDEAEQPDVHAVEHEVVGRLPALVGRRRAPQQAEDPVGQHADEHEVVDGEDLTGGDLVDVAAVGADQVVEEQDVDDDAMADTAPQRTGPACSPSSRTLRTGAPHAATKITTPTSSMRAAMRRQRARCRTAARSSARRRR